MFASIARAIFGTANDRSLKAYQRRVPQINALEPAMEALSDEALRAKTAEFRERLAAGATLDDMLPEAFAVVREASKRTLGQRHFDVQLIGGMVLHDGKIAEMKTGEGKTLVATLPVYLNALAGKGVHVVTVNDYLARARRRVDGPDLPASSGMTVGVIVHGLDDDQRRDAYAADITYGTNNEFGFDYLRDNMKYRLEDMVQRDFSFGIVDEVDSILIDEARTPLIISGPAEDSSDLYRQVDAVVKELVKDPETYEKDEKFQHRRADRARLRARRGHAARGRHHHRGQPLRHLQRLGGASRAAVAARPHAVRARRRLHRARGQGGHHRRVHRPHDGGPALFRRAAPGAGGQGARHRPGGEPDARLDHLPELLPPVSEARRHDRHGDDRGGRVRRDLQAGRGRDPDQRGVSRARTRTTRSIAPPPRNTRRWRR